MCGRYPTTRQDALVTEMQLTLASDADCAAVLATAPGMPAGLSSWWAPRWNVAPTQPAPVVVVRHPSTAPAPIATCTLMRWGLVPHWSKDLRGGAKMINARAETAAGSRAFREPLRRRRCLAIADGFYEWGHDGRPRVPYLVAPPDVAPVTFAAVWDRWKSEAGWVESFTILTCAADALVAPLHDRRPVVIAPADRARWLVPDELPPEAIADLLAPPPLPAWTVTAAEPWINAATRERGAAPPSPS